MNIKIQLDCFDSESQIENFDYKFDDKKFDLCDGSLMKKLESKRTCNPDEQKIKKCTMFFNSDQMFGNALLSNDSYKKTNQHDKGAKIENDYYDIEFDHVEDELMLPMEVENGGDGFIAEQNALVNFGPMQDLEQYDDDNEDDEVISFNSDASTNLDLDFDNKINQYLLDAEEVNECTDILNMPLEKFDLYLEDSQLKTESQLPHTNIKPVFKITKITKKQPYFISEIESDGY